MRSGVSTKTDGSMRLAGQTGIGDDPFLSKNVEHRQSFFVREGVDPYKIVSAQLVHGKSVAIVDRHSPDFVENTDGLVTRDPDIVLTVTVADCYPVFFHDPQNVLVGLAHIGWRGAARDLATETVKAFVSLGSHPEDVRVTLGPGICGRHYSFIKDSLAETDENRSLLQYSQAIGETEDRVFLDLPTVIASQLQKAGIRHITPPAECTFELPEKYFSYRRDRPQVLETMVAYITLG